MSDFDSTIVPKTSFQCGGELRDITPAQLEGIIETPAYKGVFIYNISTDAAAKIWIGYKSVSANFSIAKGQVIFLEIRDIWNLRIVGTGTNPTYTYLCY